MQRFRSTVARVALVALSLASLGCTTWRTHPDVARAVTAQNGRAVRLHLDATARPAGASAGRAPSLTLRNAWVAGDSVIGESGGWWRGATPHRQAVPVAEVRAAATRRVAVGRTLALVTVPPALAAAVAYFAVLRRISY